MVGVQCKFSIKKDCTGLTNKLAFSFYYQNIFQI